MSLLASLLPTPKSSPRLYHLFLLASLLPLLLALSFLSAIAFRRAYVPQVSWTADVYLQYGRGETPWAEVPVPSALIAPDQPYTALVHLTVPFSEWNHALGNFMCNLTFLSPSGQSSLTSSRPAIILPPSPLRLPFSSRVHHLTLPLMESVVLSRLPAPLTARLVIGRRTGDRREVQTLSAELALEAVLLGWGWWLYRYPVTSVLGLTSVFFCTSALLTLAGYALVAPPFSPASPTPSRAHQPKIEPGHEVPYRPYEKTGVQLGMEMGDVGSVETSVKSEEDEEGEMSDWSEAVTETGLRASAPRSISVRPLLSPLASISRLTGERVGVAHYYCKRQLSPLSSQDLSELRA